MVKKKEKLKEIPLGNYVKLFIIIVLTVIITLFIRIKYIEREDYNLNNPVIRDVIVNEINSNEVYNYVRENDDVILYIGVADSKNCRRLEENIKTVIADKNLSEVITYLNITNETKKASFIKEFNKFYDTKVLGYPSFVVFKDGKVEAILTTKTGKDLKLEDVVNFFDNYTND